MKDGSMHEYSMCTHKLFYTKAPNLNTTPRLRLLAVGRQSRWLEAKDKKKFPPKHEFSTTSSSAHFHVAIMLHTYSIYDETYGNLIL